jgi:hypothetical protein
MQDLIGREFSQIGDADSQYLLSQIFKRLDIILEFYVSQADFGIRLDCGISALIRQSVPGLGEVQIYRTHPVF